MDTTLTDKEIKEVLDRPRTEVVAMAPFVYKKIDLRPLEVEAELTLKFRKANYLDSQELKAKFGSENLVAAFKDLDIETILGVLVSFLTKESIKDLYAIKFTKLGDDGREVEIAYTLEERFKKIFISDTKGMMEILDLLLSIQGYTKKQIETLFVDKDKGAKKEIKKKKHTRTRN